MSADLPPELLAWYLSNKDTAPPVVLVHFDRLQLPVCMGPHEHETAGELYRQNTSYANGISNWVVVCADCRKENDAHWAERWADYYAGVL